MNLADNAYENAYDNLIRGTWHNVLDGFMTKKQSLGVKEIAEMLRARFTDRRDVIGKLVEDIATIDRSLIR